LAAVAFGFVLALGMNMTLLSTLVADPVCQKGMVWAKMFMCDPGDVRMLAFELFFIMESTHKVLNVGDFRITVLNEYTYALLFVSEGGLSFIFGSCDMLRGNSTYMVWVISGHGGVVVDADVNASAIA
jgi:hypothetical protein